MSCHWQDAIERHRGKRIGDCAEELMQAWQDELLEQVGRLGFRGTLGYITHERPLHVSVGIESINIFEPGAKHYATFVFSCGNVHPRRAAQVLDSALNILHDEAEE